MRIKKLYPEYSAIERHIHAARIERAVYIAGAIAGGIAWVVRGVGRVREALGRGARAEADRRAIEADRFVKRAVPKY